jgi:hypothetical protein
VIPFRKRWCWYCRREGRFGWKRSRGAWQAPECANDQKCFATRGAIDCGQVMDERRRQDAKWGPSADRPAPPLAVLVEEVGEVANAMLDAYASHDAAIFGTVEQASEYDEYVAHLRTELIQVAAVAVAMVEAIDRGDVPLR